MFSEFRKAISATLNLVPTREWQNERKEGKKPFMYYEKETF
jgi:hypothetical protein